MYPRILGQVRRTLLQIFGLHTKIWSPYTRNLESPHQKSEVQCTELLGRVEEIKM
jgi:hypothetical protein